jgi:tRNA U34 5-methylaminomethyl-2-thiouridine-forming methyltransferase MnmC
MEISETPHLIVTGDGSHSLHFDNIGESYHSTEGAASEALHVYIKPNLMWQLIDGAAPGKEAPIENTQNRECETSQADNNAEIRVLEMGFGTGLNALLTCMMATATKHKILYTTIEHYPLSAETYNLLNYPDVVKQVVERWIKAEYTHKEVSDGCNRQSAESGMKAEYTCNDATNGCNKQSNEGGMKAAITRKEAADGCNEQIVEGWMKAVTPITTEKIQSAFLMMHTCKWEEPVQITDYFTIEKHCYDLCSMLPKPSLADEETSGALPLSGFDSETNQECLFPPWMASCRYQSVFYDAFAPQYQPELWRAEIFAILNKVMAPGGILTTYCCKGDVKRALKSAGFHIEKIPGYGKKREMLRALKEDPLKK